jgi:hypothetical protein
MTAVNAASTGVIGCIQNMNAVQITRRPTGTDFSVSCIPSAAMTMYVRDIYRASLVLGLMAKRVMPAKIARNVSTLIIPFIVKAEGEIISLRILIFIPGTYCLFTPILTVVSVTLGLVPVMLSITLSVASSVMFGVVASVASYTVSEAISWTGMDNTDVDPCFTSTVWLATSDVPETDRAYADTDTTR